jgi:hypothetical protein
MYATEVANLLGIDPEEFKSFEHSVASVLNLEQDSEGRTIYGDEHLGVLRDVFLEGGKVPTKSEHDFESPKTVLADDICTPPESGSCPPQESPPKVEAVQFTDLPRPEPTPAPEALIRQPEPPKLQPFVERVPVQPAAPDGYQIKDLLKLMQDQRAHFETRIRDLEQGELASLKEESLRLKKENLLHKKEGDTLRHIIRNQNEDKRYLIEKLNEKFSLKNAFLWRHSDTKVFSGEEISL